MAEMVERASGLVVPKEKQKRRKTFIQDDLIDHQLPAYLKRIIEEGGVIESVNLSDIEPVLGWRYRVVYRHTELLDCGIYC